MESGTVQPLKKPAWLKKRIPSLQEISKVKSVLRDSALHTVCEEARCPNLGECFSGGTATFLILGRICTRNCGFCAVEHGTPPRPDPEEPRKLAEAVKNMGLRYVVVTSVTRDDLKDGGAAHFAEMIRALRAVDGTVKIEVLIPDFQGDPDALKRVLNEGPDVLNHNVETVPRLYPLVRPRADYERSLHLLKRSGEYSPGVLVKSGLMVGIGEEKGEVIDLMKDLRRVGCDLLTIGQYLQPRPDRLPVLRYVLPEEFEAFKKIGEEMGFRSVASGPFVRSSFHAAHLFNRTQSLEKGV